MELLIKAISKNLFHDLQNGVFWSSEYCYYSSENPANAALNLNHVELAVLFASTNFCSANQSEFF